VGHLKRLLLVGAGHAHALVLRTWCGRSLPGIELVRVSPAVVAPYSGMVPGWLAGTYRFDEICIDVAALAAAAGARLVIDELASLEPDRRLARLASGARLEYDLLSLDIGSTLEPPAAGERLLLPMRPLGRLHDAWSALLEELARAGDRSLTVTAVGGGAAGFESLLAVLHRLRSLRPDRHVAATRLGTAWEDLADDPPSGSRMVLLWATGARAHAWQRDPARRGDLAVTAHGFVRVDPHLRSVSHPQVFAAGDCAESTSPLPKAGVYAVRMAPVLARNLQAALAGAPAVSYHPQHRFLALLATADGRAIGARGRWSAEGRWLWHWKDHIDRRFLRRFQASGAESRLLDRVAAR
jgi:NADH dehydrogenase FAD-containing subunit